MEVIEKRTGVSTGSASSLTVAIPCSGKMNIHFQSIATTWTSSVFVPGGIGLPAAMRSSGRNGSSRCVLDQVTAPRQMMISSGQAQITSSSWVE